MVFRKLLLKDIQPLLQVEKQSNPHPWNPIEFENALQNHHAFVLDFEGRAIAVVIFQQVMDQADVIHLVRDFSFAQKGVGCYLLKVSLAELKRQSVQTVFLEVRRSNQMAINCYHSLGFESYSVRKHYYQNKEDAICMKKAL